MQSNFSSEDQQFNLTLPTKTQSLKIQ
uniref:Uncharacterized protein n=1 Tax=Rhizophora mucronata TaxID=61149 RepID=A0A2P2PX98_RHIMU